jgi:hypothetical protein
MTRIRIMTIWLRRGRSWRGRRLRNLARIRILTGIRFHRRRRCEFVGIVSEKTLCGSREAETQADNKEGEEAGC